jgi:prepilin-type N-terminal cleavage/methylation domain-containing protein
MKLATKRRPAAGFTLIELLISLAVMVIVLIGVLALFDLNTNSPRPFLGKEPHLPIHHLELKPVCLWESPGVDERD